MQRIARFFAMHGARAAPLAGGVPALSQLPRVFSLASDALTRHPALAEAAVRVALSEMEGLFTPYDAASFRSAIALALAAAPRAEITEISAAPLRSGIAEQTHTARIDGVPVRITLLRADARQELADDLDLALAAARFAERRSATARELQAMQWLSRVRERAFDDRPAPARRRSKLSALPPARRRPARRARSALGLCNDAVLTTRAIDTVPLSDGHALASHGLKQADLIATLIEAFFEMALGQGVYHAGLDAAGARVSIETGTRGRIVLEADNAISFFAAHERDFIVGVSNSLLEGDHKAAARTHLEHGRPEEHAAHHEVRVESTYRREAERFSSPDARQGARVSHLFDAIGKAPAEHMFSAAHGRIASRAVLLSRSMETIERMAHTVAPDVDVWKIARRVIARLAADQFGCHGLLAHLAQEATHWPQLLPRLPTLIAKRAGASQGNAF